MKPRTRNYLLDLCELGSCVFVFLLIYIMFFFNSGVWHVRLYSDPLFDRTSTYDHAISVLAFLSLFFISFWKLKSAFTSILICAFVFGIGNMLADELLLKYYWLWTFDYVVPTLSCITLIALCGKKTIKYLGLQVLCMISIYSIWAIFARNAIDCGIDKYSNYNCSIEGKYFFDPLINLLIVCVWIGNFSIGYLLITSNIEYKFKRQNILIRLLKWVII